MNEATRSEEEAMKEAAAMNEATATKEEALIDEPPPFGGSWRVLYAALLVNLVVLIVLFYIFTKAFA